MFMIPSYLYIDLIQRNVTFTIMLHHLYKTNRGKTYGKYLVPRHFNAKNVPLIISLSLIRRPHTLKTLSRYVLQVFRTTLGIET